MCLLIILSTLSSTLSPDGKLAGALGVAFDITTSILFLRLLSHRPQNVVIVTCHFGVPPAACQAPACKAEMHGPRSLVILDRPFQFSDDKQTTLMTRNLGRTMNGFDVNGNTCPRNSYTLGIRIAWPLNQGSYPYYHRLTVPSSHAYLQLCPSLPITACALNPSRAYH